MKVVLPDSSELELPDGATGLDAAAAIGPKLAEQAVLVRSNGHVQDLRLPLEDGQQIQILTTRDKDDPDALYVLRHSTAHLLAEAVRRLYPGVKISIGPPIENGFYYDFEFPDRVSISEADFPAIEARMPEHVAAAEACSREMTLARGYDEVKTPLLYDARLWETSGHWGKYRENMFTTEYEERAMGLKPMNCPGHAHLYSMQRWSYRDLPVRYSEPGLLHRREPSGTLHGLLRVRHFIQDDAHIFCTEEQVEDEVLACVDFGYEWYDLFGFDMRVELSTRPDPDKRLGDDAFWDKTEGQLAEALRAGGYDYRVAEGE